MANIFIIHGAYGNPNENWFPWLKRELEKLGHNVIVPSFPTPKGQTLESWMDVFEDYEQYLDENSVVVGHSLGPAFLLSVLETIDHSIKAAVFVAGFIGKFTGKYADPKFDEINKTFAEKSFDWVKIKQNCRHFSVFHSDNDPYVPIQKGKELASHLGVELKVVMNARHFNEAAGYTKFELLLKHIKELL